MPSSRTLPQTKTPFPWLTGLQIWNLIVRSGDCMLVLRTLLSLIGLSIINYKNESLSIFIFMQTTKTQKHDGGQGDTT